MNEKMKEIFDFIKKDFEKMKESSKKNMEDLEEDKSEFLYQLGDKLITRTKKFNEFTECEKAFYCCKTFDDEVLSSGDFYSAYTSYAGEYVYDLEKYFKLIGAEEISEIIKKANSIFPKKLPKNYDKRNDYISSIYDEIETKLEECYDEYTQYNESLDDLLYEFVVRNKSEFKDYQK